MVNTKKLLGEVESSRDEVTELCSELVKIPTPNPPGETGRCVSFIEEYFKKHGVPTEKFQRAEAKTSIVARIRGDSSHTILWLGHIDVVPAGNLEYWTHKPYGGQVENGYIYGRGQVI